MAAHFQRTFWPITATAAFFGLALIEYPLGIPRRFLSLIYAIVAVSMQLGMYVSFIMRPIPANKKMHPIFFDWVVEVMMFCCNFIILASICLTHWYRKKYQKCIEQLNEVDETLMALGIETNSSKLRRLGLVSLLMWAFMCILLNASTAERYGTVIGDKRSAIVIFFAIIPIHVRILIQMQFSSVLGYAGTRFDCICSALRKLTIDDNNCTNWFQNSAMTSVRGVFILDERARRVIWTVMHLYFKLCEILRDINTVFEIQMSLQMAFDCVFLLGNIIFAFRLILLPLEGNKFRMSVGILSWTLPFLADIIVTNHLCETVGAKARTVCDMVVQLLNGMDDEGFREDVSLIVLQTKLRPLRFSCLGLYYLGYPFMYKIFGIVVATAVIILQLKAGLDY